jgi:hypothetical protein
MGMAIGSTTFQSDTKATREPLAHLRWTYAPSSRDTDGTNLPRATGAMPISESMRIFRLACDELGEVLRASGFAYRKSKRDARRQGTLFKHVVTFGTSRSVNSLQGHVELEVRAMGWSTALGDYRRNAGITLGVNEASLLRSTIENIFHPAPPYIRYDIGDPATRRDVLARITKILRTDVLRAFDLIESPIALREALDAGPIPGLSDEDVRDYFDCFWSVSCPRDADK